VQMLSDNEVAVAIAWNGRTAAIQERGTPVLAGAREGFALTPGR
jgi:hypothetical protein